MKQSIRGKILVTRTAKDCEQWAIQLKKAGAIPVIFPCITCETIQTTDLNRMLSEGLKTSDWIVFTSRRGVSAFSSLVEELGQHELTKKIKIAVVGPATNNSATQLLGRVDLMSEAGTAKSLGEKLASILQTKCSVSPPKILILVAENAGTIIERTLTASGCECTRLNVYRTVAIKKNTHKQSLSLLDVDKIIL
ncbi:MAG: hypothetical protein CMM56_02190, partial [Rhodospirillaceae bacterium]|nr:hypothetical protein [Rhodospirillaceae bacterium]